MQRVVTVHYWSGLLLTSFILVHLVNHVAALGGASAHLELMQALRVVYRQPVVEAVLLLAVAGQGITGIRLAVKLRRVAHSRAERLQIYSGLYLAFFLLVHTGAVLTGRLYMDLDTNLYFGAAGINTFPFSLFFVPYYTLAVCAVFLHLAAVHYRKGAAVFGPQAARWQALILAGLGGLVALLILYGLTNGWRGLPIPAVYLKSLGLG
ncbi:hypothetical protein [Hymenobacter cellulosilyticus]|uniref:Succinate dehydrogenase n=1 Tax=Hymenobacter cellulosilyticus TaxID=2932248 RepID=A0A8T9PXJ2_9BACT|nr:hypothetical protein [Hymenobacter cellulosilyticus]UOQ70106.1 hypothetical protein MUN79_15145 [Hymenobacter cellulosilyticus]